ncbi:MAG TPA: hypothetical protein VLC46_18890 [Thermoanaerobaculia bacterium]|nr:hypothetical protein [Thermoanaerobaculia bacterium]
MLPYLVGAATLTLLLFELARKPAPAPRPVWMRMLLGAPFVIVAALSIFVAAQAPHGRKPFSIDFSVSREDLARSMTKVAHLRSIVVIFLLAVLAFGTRRLIMAFAMTMLVGVGWELAEATVVRHYGRLADLAPNFVSGILSLAAIAGIRWIFEARRKRLSLDG